MLFLADSIKPVTSHVAACHQRDQYTINQLPDDTLVNIKGKVSTSPQLTKKYRRIAAKSGYAITQTTSIYLKDAKPIFTDQSPQPSPKTHQKITDWQSCASWAVSNAVVKTW